MDFVVLGLGWGDEGKGRVVDYLAKNADFVVRFQGGANSGHTLHIQGGGKWVCHALPDGILQEKSINIISQGVALDLDQFFLESDELRVMGVVIDDRLFVSHRATVVLTRDKVMDFLADNNGSTKKGIRFCYERHARPRHNIRVEDLYATIDSQGRVSTPTIEEFVRKSIEEYAQVLTPQLESEITRLKNSIRDESANNRLSAAEKLLEQIKPENEMRRLMEQAEKLRPHVRDTGLMIKTAVRNNKSILYAGAQAVLLSRDVGPGDDLTSSVASGAALFSDIGYTYSKKEQERLVRLGVVKHLITRVGRKGHGFPSHDETGLGHLREKGDEKGATTGRLREMGHPDAVATAYAIETAGVDGIIYTKADLVDGQAFPARIAISYHTADGKTYERMPTKRSIFDTEHLKAKYLELPGWSGVSETRDYDRLPEEFRGFLKYFSEIISGKVGREVPIVGISTSPRREDFIPMFEKLNGHK
jgi:adenylosuccinate synthase